MDRMAISFESYNHVMNALTALEAGDEGSAKAALHLATCDWGGERIYY